MVSRFHSSAVGRFELTRNADSAPSPMRTQKGISYQFPGFRLMFVCSAGFL